MTTRALPAPFADLAPFSDWILATQPERYAKRLTSSMEEMQSFYDAAMPRMPDALDYCDGFPLDAMPDEVRHLMRLMFSVVEISFPIEAWSQARVPDSGAASMDCTHEPIV